MSLAYDRRQLLVGAAALTVAGAAYAAEPRRDAVDFSRVKLDSLVPVRAGQWVGFEDPDVVPESVDTSVDHGQTLMRRYVREGSAPVMLVVSYHGPQSPDLKVHRPETCYAVAGFAGGAPRPATIPLAGGRALPAVHFTARREDRVETVLYWTRVGSRFPQTLTGQRLDFLTEALRGVRADGLLTRMSTIGGDPSAAMGELTSFAADLVGAASGDGRTLLLGARGNTASLLA